ncbi:unnamed protein product [Timema podura]|uniref:Uncharacterized protein n=1 Tax=Timema podura TaxID=61482 RepID=A0ABN7NPR9_TIMPD|nr:unnamed protein product [Timema podura]
MLPQILAVGRGPAKDPGLGARFKLLCLCSSGILPPQGTVVERDRKKCIFYSLYAWGSTILILVISLIMEFTPGIPDTFLKPGFGKQTCWFETASIPLRDVTIMLEGVVKCAHVPLHWKEEPDTHVLSPALTIPGALHSELSGGSTGSCQLADDCPLLFFVDVNRDLPLCTKVDSFGCMLWLYMKLFSLMGITWLTEIISWAVGGPSYYWYVTDIVNILRAVFVFIIFCCKRTTLNIICVRLHGLMPCCTTAPVMTYGKENSSSQRTGSMQLTMFNNARKTSTPKTEIQNSIQPSL